MMVIRPVQENDLDGIYDLAVAAGDGLTTLPASKDRLLPRIRWSEESFRKDIKTPGVEYYFLVMEDTESGKIAGTTGVFATVGLSQPFYNFEIKTEGHHSDDPKVDTKTRALHFGAPYKGVAELGTLFLHEDFRFGGNGTFLSKSRYMLLASYPERFASKVMAEIRGYVDESGSSPFWEAIGRHFFQMDLAEADRINSLGNYQFIADLMPRHPIYIEMLPHSAQEVMTRPHAESAPARKLLESEGLKASNIIDVFDGGPCLDAKVKDIRAVKESREAGISIVDDNDCAGRYMIANTDLEGFKVAHGGISVISDNTIGLTEKMARALRLQAGDTARYVTMKRNA